MAHLFPSTITDETNRALSKEISSVNLNPCLGGNGKSRTDNPKHHISHLGVNDDDEYEELVNCVPGWPSDSKAKTAVATTSDRRDVGQRVDISKLSCGAEQDLDCGLIELRPEYAYRPNAILSYTMENNGLTLQVLGATARNMDHV